MERFKNKIFTIDFNRFILLLLPTFLRQTRFYNFLIVLVQAVVNQYDIFKKNREKNIDKIQYNGQVCKLQKLLNTQWDYENREIYLTEKVEGSWMYAYREGGSIGLLLGSPPKFLYSEKNINVNEYFFNVNLPKNRFENNEDNMNKLHSLLKEYKLLSKTYTITYY